MLDLVYASGVRSDDCYDYFSLGQALPGPRRPIHQASKERGESAALLRQREVVLRYLTLRGERSVDEIASDTTISQGDAASCIGSLQADGLVEKTVDGNPMFFRASIAKQETPIADPRAD